MPLFGLGTWLAPGDECYTSVKAAIGLGYRLIDTAAMYGNEVEVGRAVRDSGVPREEIFVVSKLMPKDHGRESTRAALNATLGRLGLSYVDLYLIHSPSGGKVVETWKEMVALRDEGLARSVGVSNFGAEQLRQLRAATPDLDQPEVNQIELHVYLPQTECVEYCRENQIVVMGFCPLARCKRFGQPGAVLEVAQRSGLSEAQVLLRWSYQSGIVTIPKTVNIERLSENAAIVKGENELSAADMRVLQQAADGFKASSAVNNMDLAWDGVK